MPNPYPVVRSRDPLAAQQYKTQRSDMPEDLWQPLYDRVNIATTVPSSISFFAVPRGQSASLITSASTAASKTKTFRDTNMDSASVVPTKMFKFVGISIAFVHGTKSATTNAADREIILNGGYLQFRIVDKDLLFLPLLALPELNPQLAVATTANATTTVNVGSGGGAGIPMYKLPIPVTLNPYENFVLNFNFDATAALTGTLDMYTVLHGFMRRPT